jgi:hypothetical protein
VDPLAVVLFTVTDWLKYTLTSGPASAADRQRTIITALLTITVHPTGQGRPFDRRSIDVLFSLAARIWPSA